MVSADLLQELLAHLNASSKVLKAARSRTEDCPLLEMAEQSNLNTQKV